MARYSVFSFTQVLMLLTFFLLLKWCKSTLCSVTTHKPSGHSDSVFDWGNEMAHQMQRNIALAPKQQQSGARTFRAAGHLDAGDRVAHVLFNTFLFFLFFFFFLLSRLHAHCGAHCGTWTLDPEIKTWPKIKSQMLNRLSHPGGPQYISFVCFCEPSKVWDPRQELLLPRCGMPDHWHAEEGHHLQWQQRGFLRRTVGGAGTGRKKWQMVVVWLTSRLPVGSCKSPLLALYKYLAGTSQGAWRSCVSSWGWNESCG